MDNEQEWRKLVQLLVGILEHAFIDVHAYWAAVTAEAPELMEFVRRNQQNQTAIASAQQRFAELRDSSAHPIELASILERVLADGLLAIRKPN